MGDNPRSSAAESEDRLGSWEEHRQVDCTQSLIPKAQNESPGIFAEEAPSMEQGECVGLSKDVAEGQVMEQGDCEAGSQDVAGGHQDLPDDVKREMLAKICKGVVVLRCESDTPSGYCDVYLVGTAHVSQESCMEVQAAIRLMKPQVVFLELCERRRFMLQPVNFQVPTLKEMLDMWQKKRLNFLGILYSWFLAKVAEKMEVLPGSEFRVAYEEAEACGAKVALGDRDVQAVSLPSVEDLKEMIQELHDVDMLTLAFQELSKSFPTVMETLVHERDTFMAAVLQKLAQHHSSIVAVVGRGHISGIAKNWNESISVDTLTEVPNKKSLWLTSFKPFFLVALVIVGIAVVSHLIFWV